MPIINLVILILTTAFELQYDSSPTGLVFIDKGPISKIQGHAQLQYKIDISAFNDQKEFLKNQIDQVCDICINIKMNVNCNLLDALLKRKSFTKSRKNREAQPIKKHIGWVELPFSLTDKMIDALFSQRTTDQKVVDKLQNDMRYNRKLINNQSIILNEIVNIQNTTINQLSQEIISLKTDILKIENKLENNTLEIRFTNLIQSMFYRILQEKEISNALTSLVFDPKPSDVLKFINKKIIIDDLKKLDEKFYPTNYSLDSLQDVLEILAVSDINMVKRPNEITVFLTIPYYTQNWTLYAIVPILFKGEGEIMEIVDTAGFMIREKNKYTLMSFDDFNKCKLNGLLYVCSFIPLNPTKSTCDVFMRNEVKLCKIATTSLKSKVIQTEKQVFLINTLEEIEISWKCPGLEIKNSKYIAENVWIKMDLGCILKVLNNTYYISNDKTILEVDLPTEKVNLAEENWKPKYVTENPNKFNATHEIHAGINKISIMVNDSISKSDKPIERIILSPAIITGISATTVIIFIVIISCCLYHYCKK